MLSPSRHRGEANVLSRIWGYIKQLFRSTAERVMDPEIEIEQAITEAKRQDQQLRNQAAKVIAHRTQLEMKLEQSAQQVGEARETATQALVRADEA
jgi:phage shock protein A